jgi:putative ABC transport system substrate-binding protein
MRRRDLIAMLGGAATAWPLASRAQQPSKPVIGFLYSGNAEGLASFMPGYRQGLADTGFVEGQNVAVEYRLAEGHFERLPDLASDLVRRGVNLISTGGGVPPVKAAEAATQTIPIVFTTAVDPATAGLVASFNRPGGNATGISMLISALVPKRIELLHSMVPDVTKIGLLINPNAPDGGGEEAAHHLGLEPYLVHVEAEGDRDAAFAPLKEHKVGAVLVGADATIGGWNRTTTTLAAHYALPAIYQSRTEMMNGGLLSYGPDIADVWRQGEKPADLPVLQPTKFDFVINLKAAKALGILVPPTLLALADDVID